MIKIKKCLVRTAIWIGVIFFIFTLFTGILLETAAVPPFMSGGPDAIGRIQRQDPNDFSFIVLGDSKCGTATLESILEITEQETPAFIVFLGDFASKPTVYAHRFFIMETKKYAERIALLPVPGNHDVDIEGAFTIDDFESLYGAAQKSFRIGNNLFILLNDLNPYNPEGQYIDFLEKTLKSQTVPPSRIFVFMHIPPAGLKAPLLCGTPVGSERFLDTARKYHIDYVFCGDHHGYVKTKLDNVNFIITGGGGAKLRGKQGRFHHAVRIAINSNEISETVIAVKRQVEAIEMLEQNIANYIWPFLVNHRLSAAVIAIIAIYLFFVRNNKRKIFAFFKMEKR